MTSQLKESMVGMAASVLVMLALLQWEAQAQIIIVDNVDSGFSTAPDAATWLTGNTAAGRYGADYRYATTTGFGSPAGAVATWTPSIPTTGYWYVYTQYPQGSNRAADAKFTVTGDSATTIIVVNQQIDGGIFGFLAQLHFAAGTGNTVSLSNNAGPNVVIADATAFKYVGQTPGPPNPGPLDLGGGGIVIPPSPEREFRGMWISRFEWPMSTMTSTKSRIDSFMSSLQAQRFNAVLFQMRGSCETLYPSPEEPWGQQFGFTNPGFDTMAYAVNSAHTRGIEFHAYINTHTIYQTSGSFPTPPHSNPEHVYWLHGNAGDPAHRDWLYYELINNIPTPQAVGESNYVWAAPGVPDFQTWERRQILYVANNYDVDGVHFDRIRVAGDGSHDPISVARQAGRGNPGNLSFQNWNRDQITRFLNDVYGAVAEVNANRAPGKRVVKVSTAPFPSVSSALSVNQDVAAWTAIGAQDFVVPQIYTASTSTFQTRLQAFLNIANGRLMVAGMNRNSAGTMDVLLEELGIARTLGAVGSNPFSITAFTSADMARYGAEAYLTTVQTPDYPWLSSPTQAIIVGNVRDAQASPLVDVWIRRDDVSNYTWLSSGDGFYAMLKVPAGQTLSITYDAQGVGTTTKTVSPLQAGEVRRIDVTLPDPGPSSGWSVR